jgi:membrane associated rhomboid family serine protease
MNSNMTDGVKNLLIINGLFFLASIVYPEINEYLTGYYFASEQFRPWQIVTHMFMHADVMHIFFNMYALYMFGSSLENYWGTKRFLVYYFVSGLGAFALHMGINFLEIQKLLSDLSDSQISEVVTNGLEVMNTGMGYKNAEMQKLNEAIHVGVVGASGAVFGVLIGFGMLFPNTELSLLFPPITLKAKVFVMIYGAIELYMALKQSSGDHVAHYAHLGGMLFGYLLLKYWQSRPPKWT